MFSYIICCDRIYQHTKRRYGVKLFPQPSKRLIKEWDSNYKALLLRGAFGILRRKMEVGKLYFVKDEFYERFKDCGLLENKDIIDGKQHNRPCCYLFKFKEMNEKVYWMIPISSQVEKYKKQYELSIKKYGICDNISFGYVLGKKCTFLPQNMFPITEKYINNIYIDKNTNKPILLQKNLIAELNKKGRKKIRYNLNTKTLGFSDISKIYNDLLDELNSEQ